jgi:hypothetical protein
VKQVVQPTTQSYSGSSSSAGENKELNQTLSKLSVAIDNLSKSQGGNIKQTNDAIIQLNQTISQLKETTEKSAAKSEQQNTEIISSLSTLNKSIESIREINAGGEKEEIKPRKFGLGISYATNLLLDAFVTSDGEDGIEGTYKGLYGGAGFNLVISTRMDKKVGFRYEPEFSVASTFYSSGGSTSRNSFFSMGSRFFAVARRKRVNIYAGPSITFFGVINTSGGDGSAKGGGGFGLHFGGEYLISSHFGINLESGMQLYGMFPTDGGSGGVFSTYGRVGGRFYF